nr:PREDICTED: uncharacterized protein LOC102354946 isoform X2 [Latimeria chalumnae]|eukprot:XP_014344404.1 PREDICTED: uncharacterized protein LOC102354946 isoform X2 [Latimeria chalumnae]
MESETNSKEDLKEETIEWQKNELLRINSTAAFPEELQALDSNTSQEGTVKSIYSLTYGLRLVKAFTQPKHRTEIVGVTYNGRKQRMILLDKKGCSSWGLLPNNAGVKREWSFPKYQFNILRKILYCRKFNVYFTLGKDFSLKVYNKDFIETCSIIGFEVHLVKFILFNPASDELITGGMDGVKFWKYARRDRLRIGSTIAMSNYGLFLRAEYPHMGQGWCTSLELDVAMQRLYLCCSSNVSCYDTNGKLLLYLPNAHETSVLSCIYSPYSKNYLTGSSDCKIKVWSDKGMELDVFRGHSRSITSLILHPETSALFISGSMDGTVRLWSLDTMSQIYNLPVIREGICWMGLTDENLLYCCSAEFLHVYHLNYFIHFWSHMGCRIASLGLCGAAGRTTRVVAMGVDDSMRIFSRINGKKLCTVLPPLSVTPMLSLCSSAYNRANGIVVFLVDPWNLWIYTARTDPACRIVAWNISKMQTQANEKEKVNTDLRSEQLYSWLQKDVLSRQATDVNMGVSVTCECYCVSSLSSVLCYKSGEGLVCADTQEFLLLGLQDGRILFMDTFVRDLKYCELKAHKNPVVCLKHNVDHEQLLNMCEQTSGYLIQGWSLPTLKLLYQIPVPKGVTAFTRIDDSMFIGFESGCLAVFDFPAEGRHFVTPLTSSREGQPVDTVDMKINVNPKKEHDGSVISVDASSSLKLFMSCGTLLVDITLDDTVSSACFLNRRGDILVGFQNHIFMIPVTKVLPSTENDIAELDLSITESFIFEDRAIKYDHVSHLMEDETTDLYSYLVPCKGFEATEEFLSKLLRKHQSEIELEQSLLPEQTKQGEDRTIPYARSEIYQSPWGSEVSSFVSEFQSVSDISSLGPTSARESQPLEQTLSESFLDQGQRDLEAQHKKKEKKPRRSKKIYSPEESMIKEVFFHNQKRSGHYELPQFGVSPGASVCGTPFPDEIEPEDLQDAKKSETPDVKVPSEPAAPHKSKIEEVLKQKLDEQLRGALHEKKTKSHLSKDAFYTKADKGSRRKKSVTSGKGISRKKKGTGSRSSSQTNTGKLLLVASRKSTKKGSKEAKKTDASDAVKRIPSVTGVSQKASKLSGKSTQRLSLSSSAIRPFDSPKTAWMADSGAGKDHVPSAETNEELRGLAMDTRPSSERLRKELDFDNWIDKEVER